MYHSGSMQSPQPYDGRPSGSPNANPPEDEERYDERDASPTAAYFKDATTGQSNADDPLVHSPLQFFSSFNFPLFYLLWHLMITHWNLANYVAWVRFNDWLLLNRPNSSVYLAMVVISSIAFWLVCGPMFFYAAKYAKDSRRRNRFFTGGIVIMYLFADVPLWMCDMSIIFYVGFIDVGQGITFVLRSLSFLVNSYVTWNVYLHRLSKFLQVAVFGSIAGDQATIAKKEAEARKYAKTKSGTGRNR